MAIKEIHEPDIYLTREEIERLQDEYRKAMQFYAGPPISFETWVRRKKRSYGDNHE